MVNDNINTNGETKNVENGSGDVYSHEIKKTDIEKELPSKLDNEENGKKEGNDDNAVGDKINKTEQNQEDKKKEVPMAETKKNQEAAKGGRGRPAAKKAVVVETQETKKKIENEDDGADLYIENEESCDVRPETGTESDFDSNDDGSDSDYGSSKKKKKGSVARKIPAKKVAPSFKRKSSGSAKKAPGPKRDKKATQSSDEDEISSESQDEKVKMSIFLL